MLARSFRPRGIAAVATFAMAACASTASPSSQDRIAPRVPSLTPTSRVLDGERIRRSGAQTAWDAIRLLVPSYHYQPTRSTSLRTPALSDPRSSESPIRLVVDGHLTGDLDALQAIPAREVVAIHFLNAIESALYFGPGSTGGAIVVQTQNSLLRR